MDKIKKELEELFDEMLTHVKGFKRKTYNGIFEKGYKKYRSTFVELEQVLGGTSAEEKEETLKTIADYIPSYALEKMQKEARKDREKLGVDYNMNMAVYIIPFLRFSQNADCEELARLMVDLWNEKKITSLKLSCSSYDDIADGFSSKLCYITTAVCEHMQKEDDCYELETMRKFRDDYLMQTEEGRGIVENYYEIAPGIVMILNMQEHASEIYKNLYQKYLRPCVQLIEEKKQEQCKNLYMQMVHMLQQQYI